MCCSRLQSAAAFQLQPGLVVGESPSERHPQGRGEQPRLLSPDGRLARQCMVADGMDRTGQGTPLLSDRQPGQQTGIPVYV